MEHCQIRRSLVLTVETHALRPYDRQRQAYGSGSIRIHRRQQLCPDLAKRSISIFDHIEFDPSFERVISQQYCV